MNVYIERFGCTRRNAELTAIHHYLNLNGYESIDAPENAHYIIISTCAFKKKEEDHSISRIRHLMKYRAKILVLGCLPDIAPSKFREFAHLDFIAPKHIDRVDDYFENIAVRYADIHNVSLKSDDLKVTPITTAFLKMKKEFNLSSSFMLRMKRYAEKRLKELFNLNEDYYYLFISRGCVGKCSYCAIKRAIGPLKSHSVDSIDYEFKKGIDNGHRHFVILGDDVGAFGTDIQNTFPRLLDHLILLTDNVELNNGKNKRNGHISFHIEEIHPKWIIYYEHELMNVLDSRKIKSILCPIQSGNDRILNLMNREHSIDEIITVLSRIRSMHPDIRLTTQVIAGFPSETDDEFQDTLNVLKHVGFDDVLIFPYHEKEITPAVQIEPKVPEEIITERVDEALSFLQKNNIKAHLSCL